MTTIATRRPALSLTTPIFLQRLEGLAAMGFGIVAYAFLDQSWLVFALLFLSPDLFMLGYLRSIRTGAALYNLGHSYAAPALLALGGLFAGEIFYGLAAIWVAHIGFDRMLGYGLKLDGGFDQTHLGPIGKAKAR
ncbi:DUF4260 domain-containing protein [Devosia soli]|nr:DUF4260 domain-containing protein [Devosia soli]